MRGKCHSQRGEDYDIKAYKLCGDDYMRMAFVSLNLERVGERKASLVFSQGFSYLGAVSTETLIWVICSLVRKASTSFLSVSASPFATITSRQ